MDILFQDECLIVINKPSGLLTIQDGYDPDLPTVKSLLEKDMGRCWIVHRLDKETSGVLLVARNEYSHRYLSMAFQNHEIKKEYHAIIYGIPKDNIFTIEQPLKVNGDRKHRTVFNLENGKPAQTSIIILQKFLNHTLVSAQPITGYTHQIRAHLSGYGYPLLGDKLYQSRNQSYFSVNALIDRTALHAFEITFTHPSTHEKLVFQAKYPPDFKQTLLALKKISG